MWGVEGGLMQLAALTLLELGDVSEKIIYMIHSKACPNPAFLTKIGTTRPLKMSRYAGKVRTLG